MLVLRVYLKQVTKHRTRREERQGRLLEDRTLSRFVRFLNHDTSLQKPLPFALFSPGSCVFLTALLNHAYFEAPSP